MFPRDRNEESNKQSKHYTIPYILSANLSALSVTPHNAAGGVRKSTHAPTAPHSNSLTSETLWSHRWWSAVSSCLATVIRKEECSGRLLVQNLPSPYASTWCISSSAGPLVPSASPLFLRFNAIDKAPKQRTLQELRGKNSWHHFWQNFV